MKKHRLLIYIISCFILGIVFTYLVYLGLWERLMEGFKSVPIWLYVVLLPVAFYLTLTLHELGHLIAFRVQHIKIRALYLTIFVFYKDEKSWHFTIKPKLWILFGGLVVPDLPPIKNDDDLKHITQVFARALIAAPIVTISFMIVMIISFFSVWLFAAPAVIIGFITIIMIYTVLLSSLYIYTFGLNTKHLYGDFVAYKKIKTDDFFQFAELYQYQSFALHDDKDGAYLYQRATSLMETQSKLKQQIFMIVTTMAYLEGVIHEKQPISTVIDQLLQNLPINRFVKTQEGLTFVYMLAEYHYHQGRVDKAFHIVNRANQHASKKLPEKLRKYLHHRAAHVMHMTYYDEFLNDNEHIFIGQGWLFDALEDPYEAAKKEHELLPFQTFVCELPEEQEKMPSMN